MQSPPSRTNMSVRLRGLRIISGTRGAYPIGWFQSLCPNFSEYLSPFLSISTEILNLTNFPIRRSPEGVRLTSGLW